MSHRVTLPALGIALLFGLGACSDAGSPPTALDAPDPSFARSSGGSSASYEVVSLPGDGSVTLGLSDAGTVVGYVTRDGVRRAAYWLVDASGTVTGPEEIDLPVPDETAAMRANDAGQMIVSVRGESTATGFVHDRNDGRVVELSLAEGSLASSPWAINAAGVVTGSAAYEDGSGYITRPVVWLTPFDATEPPVALPLPEGHVDAHFRTYLNDRGQIVTRSETAAGEYVPVRWTLGSDGSITGPEVFGTATRFDGFELGNTGQLVGNLPDSQPAILQPDGNVVTLPLVDGDPRWLARSIGDPADGQPAWVAGTSDMPDEPQAVVWTVELDGTASGPTQLPTGKHETSRALAVNADGWVAGDVTDTRRYETTSVLWMPAADDGGSDDGGGDCVPRGKGNNCK